jgi:hypothetical protein
MGPHVLQTPEALLEMNQMLRWATPVWDNLLVLDSEAPQPQTPHL